jgi:hypothetical protein
MRHQVRVAFVAGASFVAACASPARRLSPPRPAGATGASSGDRAAGALRGAGGAPRGDDQLGPSRSGARASPRVDPAVGVDADVALMAGGQFNDAHLGPGATATVARRARAAPAAYLDAFARRYVGRLSARELSSLYLANVLAALGEAAPARVDALAEALDGEYARALAAPTPVGAGDTPEHLRSRLEERRRAVRETRAAVAPGR